MSVNTVGVILIDTKCSSSSFSSQLFILDQTWYQSLLHLLHNSRGRQWNKSKCFFIYIHLHFSCSHPSIWEDMIMFHEELDPILLMCSKEDTINAWPLLLLQCYCNDLISRGESEISLRASLLKYTKTFFALTSWFEEKENILYII